MIWPLVIVIVLAGAWAIVVLLRKITVWGGSRSDGLEVASQFMTEADAFRGSVSPDDPTWDGRNRIAPPTQDGGMA